MGRRLALPGRPGSGLPARGRCLALRDRGRRSSAGRGPAAGRPGGRSWRQRRRPGRRQKRLRATPGRAGRVAPPSWWRRAGRLPGPSLVAPEPGNRCPAWRPVASGRAGAPCSFAGMQRVTSSRNFTLSLSRPCQCYCKYCAFATHQAHVHAPVDVEKILDEALRRNTKELLVLTGERPEVNPIVAERLKAWGHDDFTSYVVWACEKALERGMLPHTNLGVLSKEDLGRLREVTASQGLMLESVDESLIETVHAGSPTKQD